jgi:hypothetical protein
VTLNESTVHSWVGILPVMLCSLSGTSNQERLERKVLTNWRPQKEGAEGENMMQALGIFAAGFLLHYILNRPMTPMAETETETETPMPPSETSPVLPGYTNGGYTLMDFDGGMPLAESDPGGQRFVIFEGGSAVTGPDGKPAYAYPGTAAGKAEGERVVDVLATPEENPPELPEPSPTPPVGDLPGLPGSSGGLDGMTSGGVSASESTPSDDDVNLFVGVGSGVDLGGMKYGNDFPGLGVY